MKNILLVEDDPEIIQLLSLHLDSNDCHLASCSSGGEAIKKLSLDRFHLLILDITLPDMSGMEICKQVRQQNMHLPIMMLTSKSGEADKVLALDLGADDYVTKPFGILELMARTKALFRRSEEWSGGDKEANSEIKVDKLLIDKGKRQVSFSGNRLELTAKEFDLLVLLADSPGRTFRRTEILELIWGCGFCGYEHTVTSHINRLRIKIEPELSRPRYILTTWGTGYRFSE